MRTATTILLSLDYVPHKRTHALRKTLFNDAAAAAAVVVVVVAIVMLELLRMLQLFTRTGTQLTIFRAADVTTVQ